MHQTGLFTVRHQFKFVGLQMFHTVQVIMHYLPAKFNSKPGAYILSMNDVILQAD